MTVIGLIKLEPTEEAEDFVRVLESTVTREHHGRVERLDADLDRLHEQLRRELHSFRNRIAVN